MKRTLLILSILLLTSAAFAQDTATPTLTNTPTHTHTPTKTPTVTPTPTPTGAVATYAIPRFENVYLHEGHIFMEGTQSADHKTIWPGWTMYEPATDTLYSNGLVDCASGYRVAATPIASTHLSDTAQIGMLNQAETITSNWVNTANPWAVNEGGTGAAVFGQYGVLYGNGTGAIGATEGGVDYETVLCHTGASPTTGALTDAYVPNALTLTGSSCDGALTAVDATGIGLHDKDGVIGVWVEDGGQVGIGPGMTAPTQALDVNGIVQSSAAFIAARSNSTATFACRSYDDLIASGAFFEMFHSLSDTVGTNTTTTNWTLLGRLQFYGVDSGGNKDFGAYISATQNGDASTYVPTALVFATYSASAENANQLILEYDGDVGINVAAPTARLDVREDEASNYVGRFFNDGNHANRWGIAIAAGADNEAGDNYMITFLAGDNSTVAGYITNDDGTLEIEQACDINLKQNIVDTAKDSVGILKSLKVRDFERKEIPEVRQTGFIAQEMEAVLPDAVHESTYTATLTTGATQTVEITNATGETTIEERWVWDTEERTLKTIRPLKLIPILWEQNRKQQEQLDAQAILIDDLQKRVAALEKTKSGG